MKRERRARLVGAVRRDLVLDPELSEERNHRRHERLADDDGGSLATREERGADARLSQEGRQRRARRSAADDRDSADPFPHPSRTIDERRRAFNAS
jgi:hypothetical protein